jgi:hypothetical protein
MLRAGPMLPALAHQAHVTAVDMSPVMVAAGAGGIAGAVLCPLLPLVRARRRSCACIADWRAAHAP